MPRSIRTNRQATVEIAQSNITTYSGGTQMFFGGVRCANIKCKYYLSKRYTWLWCRLQLFVATYVKMWIVGQCFQFVEHKFSCLVLRTHRVLIIINSRFNILRCGAWHVIHNQPPRPNAKSCIYRHCTYYRVRFLVFLATTQWERVLKPLRSVSILGCDQYCRTQLV